MSIHRNFPATLPKITIAEARALALATLAECEARRARFAEEEAARLDYLPLTDPAAKTVERNV